MLKIYNLFFVVLLLNVAAPATDGAGTNTGGGIASEGTQARGGIAVASDGTGAGGGFSVEGTHGGGGLRVASEGSATAGGRPRDWAATRARLDRAQLEQELGRLDIPPPPSSEQPASG